MKEIFNRYFTKIFKIHFIAIFIFFISNLLFATEDYVINTSSSISNQIFENYSQNEEFDVFYAGQSTEEINTEHYIISTSSFISNQTFENYSQDDDGGVFYITRNGTITISSTVFSENAVSYCDGGAICNEGTITISSTVFIGNIGRGGAIYNKPTGLITISSTVFSENGDSHCDGGAICNEGTITISSIVFIGNIGRGGAIYNKPTGLITISSTVFSENGDSHRDGGAIRNTGTITIKDDVKFENNIAKTGGAICNEGTLNLIANINDIEFTGNTASGISNAIQNNEGVINLWANNAKIIFNDRITSYEFSGIININKAVYDLPVGIGKITLNEDMSGCHDTINLYGGEIELKAKTEENSNININKFFSGNINLENGTLNILNNAIDDNIIISKLTTTSNTNLKFDVDLSNNTSDNFTITNNVSGEIKLAAINILGVSDTTGQITVFNNGKSPDLKIGLIAIYDGYEYIFSTTTILGILSYKKGDVISFKNFINRISPEIKSYSLSDDEIVNENLENLGGEELTIFGNNKNIIGYNVDGIYVGKDKILNIENVNNWGGFNNTYGAIKNERTLNISGTNFSNNEGKDIINNGNLILADISSSFEKGIIGTGTTTISGVSINLANAVIEQNKIEINNNGSLTVNASSITSYIENNSNLIFTGGINNNIITGIGLTQIYDNVTNQANITQNNLEILANKQLTNSSNIAITDLLTINNNAKVINNDKLLISSGTNNGSIDQTTNTSITTINGNFVNNGTIKQKELNIVETGKIINNNNITAKITNSGILILNYGTENNNEIIGNGKLYINYNLINNNVINQKEIEINSNINMASSLGNTEQKLNEFINNSEISAKKLKLTATMLKLTENGILKVDNFYSEQNSVMDLANNKIQQHNFKTISVTDNLNLSVDVDLINKQMDTITTDNYDGTGKININAINILTDTKQEQISITFTTSTVLKGNIASVNTANSKVFKYDVEYNKNLGNLIFSLTKDINFTVIESQVANSVGGFVTQTTIFNQAFASMENIKSRILQVKNKITDESPLYASTANTIFFQKTNRIESGLWLRPFYSQETVNLDNLSVNNTLTGTLAGLDLATGENSLVSLYLGYAGSEQKYENIKVSQTGYILGVTGMLLKEQWYAGLTANINFNKAESQSSYGTDNFDMNMYSIGAKAGYNYEINDNWTLEPNLMLMYGNVNSQEYQTTQGAKIEGQSIANIIFEPQIKAKLNLENGWQPYGLIGYVVNAGDKVTTKVEEVEFDGQKIGNYVEFGAGVDKSFKNSPWSLYIQLTGRSGDRTGFDGNFGIKYSFLTAKEKRKIVKIKKIQAKRKAKEEFLREKKRAELKEQQEIEEENKRIQQEEQEEQRRLEIQRRIKANYEE